MSRKINIFLYLTIGIVLYSLKESLFLGNDSLSQSTIRIDTGNSNCSNFEKEILINDLYETKGKDGKFDTTIVINTSLIKTHPSLELFNATFSSLRYLHGLPANTPIVITIDGLISKKLYRYQPNDTKENKQRLQEYVRRLRLRFKNDNHVTILHSYDAGLLTINLKMAMEHVDTKFVLVIQHDLSFIHEINYTALMQSMKENPELNIVRFHNRRNIVPQKFYTIEDIKTKKNCTSIFRDEKNGLEFVPQIFSDRNHITSKKYYINLLQMIGDNPRFMEAVMMNSLKKDLGKCREFGQWIYGPLGSGPYIKHLDGKNSNGILSE